MSVLCWLIGHKYFTRQEFSPETRRVGCNRCSGDWAMNDRIRVIVPWSGEFDRFYQEHGQMIKEANG